MYVYFGADIQIYVHTPPHILTWFLHVLPPAYGFIHLSCLYIRFQDFSKLKLISSVTCPSLQLLKRMCLHWIVTVIPMTHVEKPNWTAWRTQLTWWHPQIWQAEVAFVTRNLTNCISLISSCWESNTSSVAESATKTMNSWPKFLPFPCMDVWHVLDGATSLVEKIQNQKLERV